ncbi:hypothetical protein C6P42_004442 [Pichia californica]|nr:hypothetical protein C6P42_004442 [[Candida] californica]
MAFYKPSNTFKIFQTFLPLTNSETITFNNSNCYVDNYDNDIKYNIVFDNSFFSMKSNNNFSKIKRESLLTSLYSTHVVNKKMKALCGPSNHSNNLAWLDEDYTYNFEWLFSYNNSNNDDNYHNIKSWMDNVDNFGLNSLFKCNSNLNTLWMEKTKDFNIRNLFYTSSNVDWLSNFDDDNTLGIDMLFNNILSTDGNYNSSIFKESIFENFLSFDDHLEVSLPLLLLAINIADMLKPKSKPMENQILIFEEPLVKEKSLDEIISDYSDSDDESNSYSFSLSSSSSYTEPDECGIPDKYFVLL